MKSARSQAARQSRPAASVGEVAPNAGSLRLAAIDVGSNSIHMIVSQVDADGGTTRLWRMKEPTGLGRLSFPSGHISPEAMGRAMATLARFQHAARIKSVEKIIAVATAAVREAENGGDLIERARQELNLPIRVVSAREEARLIYLGVRHAGCLGDSDDVPALAIDIGGGSVEFMVGTNQRALLLESRKLGAARMSAQFIRSDPPSADELGRLRSHYRKELAPLMEDIGRLGPARAVGTSGTFENIARLCATEKSAPLSIEAGRLDSLAQRLTRMTSDERGRMPELDEGRKDQIIAGVLLVQALLEALKPMGLDRLAICSAALREGIVVDYVQRKLPSIRIRRDVPDPRRRSVLDLCRRCEWHREHSEQVTMLTMRLFDELRPLHGLGTAERELIEYAALMHDIGWHIDGKGHHKHAAYLIQHGKLRDFDDEEVQVMANIARYHRKSLPSRSHPLYERLDRRARDVVDVGAALLRIADGLDRSHSAAVRDLGCRIGESEVEVVLDVRADAELEVWGARRKADLFERVFGRPVTFTVAAGAHDGGGRA